MQCVQVVSKQADSWQERNALMLSNTCSASYLDLSSGLLRISFKSIHSNQTRLLRSCTFIIPGILLELSKIHQLICLAHRVADYWSGTRWRLRPSEVGRIQKVCSPSTFSTLLFFQKNIPKYPKLSQNVPKMHFASGTNSETGGMIMGGSGIGGVQW